MNEKIEAAPVLSKCREDGVHGRSIGDIAGEHVLGADVYGERLDPLFQGVALIGEGQFSTLGGARFGDAPGDGPVVGDAHDQAALSGHQSASWNARVRLYRRHRPSTLGCKLPGLNPARILHKRAFRSSWQGST